MVEERDAARILEQLVEAIRLASAEGRLVSLNDAAEQCFPECTPEEALLRFSELLPQTGDLKVIGEGERAYLYAPDVMSDSFARMAHSVLCSDTKAQIAEVVREDSRRYPRPTPATIFGYPPFGLSSEEVVVALKVMSEDPEYADIQSTVTSDGQTYLYSATYMVKDLAEARAEWDAVGRLDNP